MSTQNSGRKLLTEMRDFMRRAHYSIHTERSYCDWVNRFIRFHRMRSRKALSVDAGREAGFIKVLRNGHVLQQIIQIYFFLPLNLS